jgi:hypothetical protein
VTHLAKFTVKELELLETLDRLIKDGYREGLVVKAAIRLKLSPVTVRTRLSRMRSKYGSALSFCREYRNWQQKLFKGSGGRFNPLSRRGS